MALPLSLSKHWHEMSDLTIYDAIFWMIHETDPEQHTYRCECDPEFASNYSDNPHGEDAVYEKSKVLISAVRSGYIKTTNEFTHINPLEIAATYILKSDWIRWCQQNGFTALSNLFSQQSNPNTSTGSIPSCKLPATTSAAIIAPITTSPVATTCAPSVAPKPKSHKLNRNTLDPAIDEAIKRAGNMELADVFLKLKEMALNSHSPFTGGVGSRTLNYTNDNNVNDNFSKDALGKRLKIRRNNAV